MVARGPLGALGGPVGVAVRARAYGRRAAGHPTRCPGGRPTSAPAGRACPEACGHHGSHVGRARLRGRLLEAQP
eukprot:10690432-Alexandrium_andersonii.AAC.1